MWRRFSDFNFIQFVYIYYIICTIIILYIQECTPNFFQRGYKVATENSLEVHINPISNWKYVENMICIVWMYAVNSSLLNSILSMEQGSLFHDPFSLQLVHYAKYLLPFLKKTLTELERSKSNKTWDGRIIRCIKSLFFQLSRQY